MGDEAEQEAIALARGSSIANVVHQAPLDTALAIDIAGDFAALFGSGPAGGPMKLVAGVGFEPTTFRL